MPDTRVLPSVEALLSTYLRAGPDVAAIVGTRIGTELYAGSQPAVWFSLVTGEERVRNHLVAPVFDIRSYGGSKGDADLLARTVHAWMHQMPGVHATAVVSDVGTLTLPFWLPDEGFEPPRSRYLATYQLTLRPLPS